MDHDGLLKTTSSAAVVTSDASDPSGDFVNKVLADYTVAPFTLNSYHNSSTFDTAILNNNPGQLNWNYLAARNSYFQKGNNIEKNVHKQTDCNHGRQSNHYT